jgi:ADP-ribose pyrophosphatase
MTTLPAHPDIQIAEQRRVWDGRFPLDVIRFRYRRFDGAWSAEKTWELWRRGPAAAALPYDPVADAVVLIELPAGLADPRESAETTARRETAEETGLHVGRLMKIADILLTPGGADECCALFVAELTLPDAARAALAEAGAPGHAELGLGGLASEAEDIRVRAWPAEAAIAAAMAGRIANSVAAIGLLWLATQRARLQEEWSRS